MYKAVNIIIREFFSFDIATNDDVEQYKGVTGRDGWDFCLIEGVSALTILLSTYTNSTVSLFDF